MAYTLLSKTLVMRINYQCFLIGIFFVMLAGKSFSKEPSITEVIQVAIKGEGIDLGSLKNLEHKMKKSAWLPDLYLEYDHSIKDSSSISISDNISVSSSGVVVGPEDNDLDISSNTGILVRGRFVWKLSSLVFHPSQLTAQNLVNERYKLRQNLRDMIYKLYWERKKLVKAEGKTSCFQINQLTEALNVITHNHFTNQWTQKKECS